MWVTTIFKFWVAYLSFIWWVFLLVPLSLICYADSFIEADNFKLFNFASCSNKAHACNVSSAQPRLQTLSGNEASGTEQMLYMHEDAASICCLHLLHLNRAPKRLSNSFINQGLQVQLFLQPIRNSVYDLGSFTAQGMKKHKNVWEGQGRKSS